MLTGTGVMFDDCSDREAEMTIVKSSKSRSTAPSRSIDESASKGSSMGSIGVSVDGDAGGSVGSSRPIARGGFTKNGSERSKARDQDRSSRLGGELVLGVMVGFRSELIDGRKGLPQLGFGI